MRDALKWLKQNNPLYRDVDICESNLCSLPMDDVLPYHVECVAGDDAQDSLTSGYNNANAPVSTPSATHFESVVVADVDVHTPANQLRATAVHHAKTNGKPFVQIAHGPSPVNEFNNTDLFPMLYPTLFAYGCGGFEDCTLSDCGIPLYKTWNTNGLLYNESRLADSLTTKTICSTGFGAGFWTFQLLTC